MQPKIISLARYRAQRLAKLGRNGQRGWFEFYRVFIDASLDRLGDYIEEIKMLAGNAVLPEDAPVLIITRVFNAPRTLVWKMFSEPYHLMQWWGPKGFTNPVCEMDFRVGGRWHHVMRSPDGKELPTDSVFLEIVAPERIVYRNAAASDPAFGANPPPSFLRTLSFVEAAGQTTLTLRAEFADFAKRDKIISRGFVDGTNQSFDKLDIVLEEESGR